MYVNLDVTQNHRKSYADRWNTCSEVNTAMYQNMLILCTFKFSTPKFTQTTVLFCFILILWCFFKVTVLKHYAISINYRFSINLVGWVVFNFVTLD